MNEILMQDQAVIDGVVYGINNHLGELVLAERLGKEESRVCRDFCVGKLIKERPAIIVSGDRFSIRTVGCLVVLRGRNQEYLFTYSIGEDQPFFMRASHLGRPVFSDEGFLEGWLLGVTYGDEAVLERGKSLGDMEQRIVSFYKHSRVLGNY